MKNYLKAFLLVMIFFSLNAFCVYLFVGFDQKALSIILGAIGNLFLVTVYFKSASNTKCRECGAPLNFTSNGMVFYNEKCSKCKAT